MQVSCHPFLCAGELSSISLCRRVVIHFFVRVNCHLFLYAGELSCNFVCREAGRQGGREAGRQGGREGDHLQLVGNQENEGLTIIQCCSPLL